MIFCAIIAIVVAMLIVVHIGCDTFESLNNEYNRGSFLSFFRVHGEQVILTLSFLNGMVAFFVLLLRG